VHRLILNSTFRPRNVITYMFRVIFHSAPLSFPVHCSTIGVSIGKHSVLYEVRSFIFIVD
jgi:hypothetical protein